MREEESRKHKMCQVSVYLVVVELVLYVLIIQKKKKSGIYIIMYANMCAWCFAMDWHPNQGVFMPYVQKYTRTLTRIK